MQVNATITMSFEIHHPDPFGDGQPSYETCDDDADRMLARLLEENAVNLASVADRNEFDKMVESLLKRVEQAYPETTSMDGEVYRAIEFAFRDLLQKRGWSNDGRGYQSAFIR